VIVERMPIGTIERAPRIDASIELPDARIVLVSGPAKRCEVEFWAAIAAW